MSNYETAVRQQIVRETGEQFARDFSNFVNDMRDGPKAAAVEAMLRDHRTLQQGMMRFFMQFVEGMADQRSDLRNEASVKLAKAIMDLPIEVRSLPYI